MKPWLAIIRLLSVLAIVGFVLAPFTVPAAAGGMTAATTGADTQIDSASAGSGVTMVEVPCCMPKRPSVSEGSKVCPLAAVCHAKIVDSISIASAVVRWFSPAQALVPGDDATPETLAKAPLLVLTGTAFLTGWITNMSYWLLETFPALATLG